MTRQLPISRLLAIVLAAVLLVLAGGGVAAADDPAPSPQPGPSPTAPGSPEEVPDQADPTPDAAGTGEPDRDELEADVRRAMDDVNAVIREIAQRAARAKCEDDENMLGIPSVECMTQDAVNALFGSDEDRWVAETLASWLIELPPFSARATPATANAAWVGQSIGFALLLGIVTFAVLHHWAAGLGSGAGVSVLMDAVLRCAGAALLILAWPFVFESVINVTNVVTNLMLPNGEVTAAMTSIVNAGMMIGGIAGGGIGGALAAAILIVIAFTLLYYSLLIMKLAMVAGLMVAFIGMPIAIALWPLPTTTAPASYGVRFIGMVTSTAIMWAIAFRAFGTANMEFQAWGTDVGLPQHMLLPLIGIAELGALMVVPKHAATMWNISPLGGRTPGGGMVRGAFNMAGGRLLSQAASKGLSQLSNLIGQRPPKPPTPPTPPRPTQPPTWRVDRMPSNASPGQPALPPVPPPALPAGDRPAPPAGGGGPAGGKGSGNGR
ncbi:hypothetical protein VSS74_31315, partial [Conexibacter stalactiti]|nr:hypothetical protein [Conexibacter stalactiti]MEC5039532.1 hypothetical protein [Conexibacter stalactiti]